jgi:6-phosphogluconate dehydrogenase-like protein
LLGRERGREGRDDQVARAHVHPLTGFVELSRRLLERLAPSQPLQAQRDYFGAHTYQRIDAKGTFHTQ